jgi:nicotinamidase/pyrazinamidase
MKNTAVVVVDLQNDFALKTGKLYVLNGEKTIGPIANYLFSLDPEKIAAVVFTLDTHDEKNYAKSTEARQFPLHCEKHTGGHKVVVSYETIDTEIPVFEIEKGVFDAWAEDTLYVQNIDTFERYEREEFFENLQDQDVDTLEVVGLAENFCVRWFIEGAIDRCFKVRVFKNMTAPIITEEPYNLEDIFAKEIAQGKLEIVY